MLRKGGEPLPHIRPVSDLRNNFADISRIVHETAEPVFLTKNGYGDMVVMSIEAYERKLFESEVYIKLKEAELEAKSTDKRYSHEEVLSDLRARLTGKLDGDNA
jgi:prevent-host-death family protein